jgi:hypothetical protein
MKIFCEAPFTVISLSESLLSLTPNGLPPGPVRGLHNFYHALNVLS